MEEELHERPLYRRFAGLEGVARLPDGSTILRFTHLLVKHGLVAQIFAAINAMLESHGLMLKQGKIVDRDHHCRTEFYEKQRSQTRCRYASDKEGQSGWERLFQYWSPFLFIHWAQAPQCSLLFLGLRRKKAQQGAPQHSSRTTIDKIYGGNSINSCFAGKKMEVRIFRQA